ncbi:Ferredoxin, partial [Symbiodinium necroappetens]
VFVGLAWMLFGLAVLVWTLVGSEDEPCSICTETPQSGFRLCRLGVGQECAFAHHSSEVIASIVLIGVGMVLSIYATCLYRPRSKSAEAIAEEEAKAKKNYQALAARLKKTE